MLKECSALPIFCSQEIESTRTCNSDKETASEAKVDKMRHSLINRPFQNKQRQNDETQKNRGSESLPQFLEAFYEGYHELGHMLDSYAAKNDDAPALRPFPR